MERRVNFLLKLLSCRNTELPWAGFTRKYPLFLVPMALFTITTNRTRISQNLIFCKCWGRNSQRAQSQGWYLHKYKDKHYCPSFFQSSPVKQGWQQAAVYRRPPPFQVAGSAGKRVGSALQTRTNCTITEICRARACHSRNESLPFQKTVELKMYCTPIPPRKSEAGTVPVPLAAPLLSVSVP